MSGRLRATCMLLAATFSLGCLSANGKPPRASYPSQLHGIWQGGSNTCLLPGNLDSDARMEIKPDKLIDYEQWNGPTAVSQISKKPLAWKIRSRLHIDEHWIDHHEIYALSSDLEFLTVIDESRSATYSRCR